MKTLLINGCVYDGEGNPPEYADILIRDDRIARIGASLEREGVDEIIDVSGYIVTPGFVDMHRHCDKSPFEMPSDSHSYGTVLLRQGITSVVTGNCGISMYPLSGDPDTVREMRDYYAPVLGDISAWPEITSYERYLEKLKGSTLPVNTAAMIGMGAIRIAVKGFSEEPLTREEIKVCEAMVEEAMKLGAPGVSIGLMYLPECYGTEEELGEILKPVGRYGRRITAHIRGEGDSLVKSVEEVIRIGRAAGCAVEISHFKACGMQNWNREVFKAIRVIEEARQAGQQVDCDFYPYDCGSTTLLSMIPPAFVEGNLPKALAELETEPGRERLRRMLEETYEDWDNYAISLGWDKVILSAASCEQNRLRIGKSISEIAEEPAYRDEVDAAADLLCSEHGTAAIIIRSMDQKDIDVIAGLPYSCLISDAIYAETDRPHPRMYGAFPRLIREYVRDRGVIPLAEALKKMTSVPAGRMGLGERGSVREGYFADLNVFRLDEFADRATYLEPTLCAEGLKYCFVNGKMAVKDDRVLSEAEGRVLFFI